MKIRAALNDVGVWGVIVSDEPLLPRVEWDPDAKVESYMNAADAVVALCTPDNTLDDGTVRTRPNIIDEIRMARERPNLRDPGARRQGTRRASAEQYQPDVRTAQPCGSRPADQYRVEAAQNMGRGR